MTLKKRLLAIVAGLGVAIASVVVAAPRSDAAGVTAPIYYKTWDTVGGSRWLPVVYSTPLNLQTAYPANNTYAGNFGHPVRAVSAKATLGYMQIAYHCYGGGAFDSGVRFVNDWTAAGLSCAYGVDAVAIRNFDVSGGWVYNHPIHYRVHVINGNRWLPAVTGYSWNDSVNGYAGNFGQIIDAVQITWG